MITKLIIIVGIAVLATVGLFVFGKMAEGKEPEESSQKKK